MRAQGGSCSEDWGSGGGGGGGGGHGWQSRFGSIRLLTSQLALADSVGTVLDLHALEVQPLAVERLRELLDPWLVGGGGGMPVDDEGGPEEPCPICLGVIHHGQGQLPRVRCGTCVGRFHAACIYRWLEGKEGVWKCPLCQTEL